MLRKIKKIEKVYYSIGEVAELFDVNTSLIRFWEKEFDVLKPMKNKKVKGRSASLIPHPSSS